MPFHRNEARELFLFIFPSVYEKNNPAENKAQIVLCIDLYIFVFELFESIDNRTGNVRIKMTRAIRMIGSTDAVRPHKQNCSEENTLIVQNSGDT